ncbi:MAG: radical SAM protein, partial [Candidatus Methylomirabilales bacterium]
IKAGGVTVGVIVMVGVGGDLFWERHVKETTKVLNAMGLGPGDLLYFSEFVEHPEPALSAIEGSEYAQMAQALGIKPLTRREIWHQMEAIRSGLMFPPDSRGPKVSVYDIREFLY